MTVAHALPLVPHADGDDATRQLCQRLRSSRVLPSHAAQALDPAAAARNHPMARQQDNAACRVFQPDARQMHPVVPTPQVSRPGLDIPTRRRPV